MYFLEFEQLAEDSQLEVDDQAVTKIDDYIARLSLGEAQNIIPWKVSCVTSISIENVLIIMLAIASDTQLIRIFYRLECPSEGGSIEIEDFSGTSDCIESFPPHIECNICDEMHPRDECLVIRFQRLRNPENAPEPSKSSSKSKVLSDFSVDNMKSVSDMKANPAIAALLEKADSVLQSTVCLDPTPILFIAGDREGNSRNRAQITREYVAVEDAIKKSRNRHLFRVASPIYEVTLTKLIDAHNEHAGILHFAGHGDERSLTFILDQVILVSSTPVDEDKLVNIIRHFPDRVKLCVLNTCNSAPLAKHLVNSRVVDCAIGWPDKVTDEVAITFAQVFYKCLGDGLDLLSAKSLASESYHASIRPELYTIEKPGEVVETIVERKPL